MNRFSPARTSGRRTARIVARLFVVSLFGAGLLTACRSVYENSSFSQYVSGSYNLQTINGAALPVVLPQTAPGDASPKRVYSGTLDITVDGKFTLKLAESDTATHVADPTLFQATGGWQATSPSTIVLNASAQDPSLVFPTDFAGTGALEFTYLGGRFHFAKP